MKSSEIEEVYRAIRERLWGYIRSIVRDTHASEDIFQKSWVKVLPAISQKGLDRESIVPYIFRIARNECMDHFRRRSRESKAIERLGNIPVARPIDRSAAIRGVIDACLSNPELTEQRQELLRLRLIGELKVNDLAEIAGISRRTAYRELAIGLQILGIAFEKAGLGPEILDE